MMFNREYLVCCLTFISLAKCMVLVPNSYEFEGKNIMYHEKTPMQNFHVPPKYVYSYGLKDHNPREISNRMDEYVNDGYFSGEYSLAEADGTIRTMKYVVDENGKFDAIVTQSQDKPKINRQYDFQEYQPKYYHHKTMQPRKQEYIPYGKIVREVNVSPKYPRMITTIMPVNENSYKIYIKQPRYIYQ